MSEIQLPPLNDAVLQDLYTWVDSIPLSRPKKNIARDFSDGVLMSEVVQSFYPKFVDLHNYASTNAIERKKYNWQTLNKRLFRKMGFSIGKQEVLDVVNAKKGAIERVLLLIRKKMNEYEAKRQQRLAQQKNAHDVSASEVNQDEYPGRHDQTASSSNLYSHCGQRYSGVSHAESNEYEHIASELESKNHALSHSQQTVEILQEKIDKLEQLVALKDRKLKALTEHMKELQHGERDYTDTNTNRYS